MVRFIAVIAAAFICSNAGAWEYLELLDDFDETTAYVLQVESSTSVEGTDLETHFPFLQLRCDEDDGQPYWRMHWFAIIDETFSTNSIIGVVSDISIRVRIDGEEDRRAIWDWGVDESLEGISTFRVPAIVRALEDSEELRVRIVGQFGKTYDATFDVSGLNESIGKLGEHCKRI